MMITRVFIVAFSIHIVVLSIMICVKRKTKKHSKNVGKNHTREKNHMNSYSSNVSASPEPIIPIIVPPPAGGEHVYEDIMVLDMLSPQNGSVNY